MPISWSKIARTTAESATSCSARRLAIRSAKFDRSDAAISTLAGGGVAMLLEDRPTLLLPYEGFAPKAANIELNRCAATPSSRGGCPAVRGERRLFPA